MGGLGLLASRVQANEYDTGEQKAGEQASEEQVIREQEGDLTQSEGPQTSWHRRFVSTETVFLPCDLFYICPLSFHLGKQIRW